jgi:hypothetical protein
MRGVRRVGLAAAGASAIAMVMASVAGAATNKLGGEVKGADDAKVSMTVALNNQGDPARVKDLKITGLDYACEDGTTVERGVNLGDTNVRRKGGYSVALDLTARRQGTYVRMVSPPLQISGTGGSLPPTEAPTRWRARRPRRPRRGRRTRSRRIRRRGRRRRGSRPRGCGRNRRGYPGPSSWPG